MSFNSWHDLTPGSEAPSIVTSIIEIPRGSKAKFELDKETGMIKLDRVLKTPMVYPTNYGFIPQTYCEDNDPLDIYVLCSQDLPSLTRVEARVIGVIKMIDKGEMDDKIIAVANDDAYYEGITDVSQLPAIVPAEMKVFLEDYKKLEKKKVEVTDVLGREEALKIVEGAIALYKTSFPKA